MIEVDTGKPIWALGLMSGTSMDGVDAAMLLTDGETISEFGYSAFSPYSEGDAPALQAVAADWQKYRPPTGDVLKAELAQAEADVARSHANAIVNATTGPAHWHDPVMPQVVGFHGQTVAHAPDEGWTWQLGDGDALSRILNRPVVWDFRTEDVGAGGEGAPLAPFYHFALAKHIGAAEPLAFLNIGGVANLTWVDPMRDTPEEDGALLAFDTGPGNAMVNDWMKSQTGAAYDANGVAAAGGLVHGDRLVSNSGSDYLSRPGPKSLDRNDFHGVLRTMEGLSVDDGAATLTAFTADCVAASVAHMPSAPARWLVCGGGRLNKTMMAMLSERLEAPVEPVEAVGLDGDMLEAQAFAYLAVRVLRGLPTSAPSTTGCKVPICGGRISHPSA